jgi:hypothetical protein
MAKASVKLGRVGAQAEPPSKAAVAKGEPDRTVKAWCGNTTFRMDPDEAEQFADAVRAAAWAARGLAAAAK